MDENTVERRLDTVENRVKRVEDEQVEFRRQLTNLNEKVHTVHLDLVKGNGLTEATRDAVVRIEKNTSASFDRIELHTKESLNELRASVKGAVDLATTTKVMGSRPVSSIVSWIVSGVTTVIASIVFFKDR